MKKRLFSLLLLLALNMYVLTGCWNYREANNLSIIAGMAIDRDEQGKYKITAEIVDMHEGGREAKIKSKKLESQGSSILDALRNAIKINATKLYLGHMEIVILSQEVAKDGILEVVDFLERDAEPRLTIDLLISKEKTAKELLESKSITTEIRSYEINKMLDAQRNLSKAPKVQVYEFVNALSGEGISPVVPAIGLTSNEGESTSELSGTAVFKKDKLIGFLNEDETKSFFFIRGKIKGGMLILKDNSEDEYENITLEVVKSKTKVKPVQSKGKLSIDIEIKTEAVISEHGIKKSFIQEDRSIILQKYAEELLKRNIKEVIQRGQKYFDSDIFGFGKAVREEMPTVWKEVYPDWNQIFKDMNVNVNVSLEILQSGLLSKPVKVGD